MPLDNTRALGAVVGLQGNSNVSRAQRTNAFIVAGLLEGPLLPGLFVGRSVAAEADSRVARQETRQERTRARRAEAEADETFIAAHTAVATIVETGDDDLLTGLQTAAATAGVGPAIDDLIQMVRDPAIFMDTRAAAPQVSPRVLRFRRLLAATTLQLRR